MKTIDYVDLFSGSNIGVLRVKDLLEQDSIPVMIQDDFYSGNLGGFLGGTPSTIRLRVRLCDLERSRALIQDQHPL